MEANSIQKEFGVDVNSPVYNERLDELDKTLVDIVGTLSSSLPVKNIQEDIFQHVFLPIFLGETLVSHGATIDTWVNYAGGPYLPVNVINKENELLFQVPSLYRREVVNSNIQRKENIADIMNMAKKHHELSPKRGDAYRVAGLNNLLQDMYNTEKFLTNFEEWNVIFKRYGKGFDVEIKNNSVDVSNDTKQQSAQDEFIYD